MAGKGKSSRHGSKTKTAKQFRYLMSKRSPLTQAQKDKMVSERRSGKLKIKG